MLLTLAKSGEILSLFTRTHPEWGVTEAGLALDIPKSSAHALMSSLASIGLLQRGQMGRYRLGWRISSLNRLLMTTTQFREISREAMERLHGRFRDTVHLGVLDGPDVVFLEIVRSAHSVPVPGADTGERKPAARISLGKALLACRPWEEVQAFYRPHKSASRITSAWSGDIDELERELAIIRMQGYALYSSSDFFAVGAPIWDYSGEVVAALSMSVPASRFEFHQQRYVGAVIESSNWISDQLGAAKSSSHRWRELCKSLGCGQTGQDLALSG